MPTTHASLDDDFITPADLRRKLHRGKNWDLTRAFGKPLRLDDGTELYPAPHVNDVLVEAWRPAPAPSTRRGPMGRTR